jgi:hypothetical protein
LWGGVPARHLRQLDHTPALADAAVDEREPVSTVKG